jgi:hypothetical protein
LIIAQLVNADFVVISMNVYVRALSIENIATTIPPAKSIVVTRAPVFTMTLQANAGDTPFCASLYPSL